MSVQRSVVRRRCRDMLRDMNLSDPIASDYVYNDAIERNVAYISGRVFMTPTAVASTSLVAGTYEYTLTDVQIQSILQAFLNSDGSELAFVPWDEFNARYRQDTADAAASGTPREYTFQERSGVIPDTMLRVGPTPDEADAVDLYYSALNDSAATPSPTYQTMADTTVIRFSDDLARALQLAVAGEIASSASPELLAKRGLSKDAGAFWLAGVTPIIRAYNARMRNQMNNSHILRSIRTRSRVVRA